MDDPRLLLVMYPFKSRTVYELFSNLEAIASEIGPTISVTAGERSRPNSTRYTHRGMSFNAARLKERRVSTVHRFEWLVLFVLIELELAARVIQYRRNVDTAVFFLGPVYLLPAAIARLLGIRTVLIIGGSHSEHARHKPWSDWTLSRVLELLSFALVDCVGLEHENEAVAFSSMFKSCAHKFIAGAARYVDVSEFKPRSPFEDRPKRIGFLGRLDRVKGFEELLAAFPMMLANLEDYEVVVIGEGPLKSKAVSLVSSSSMLSRVKVAGWLERTELPLALAQMRLLLIPSYSEGLPTVLLEAMACGTPCACSPVGAIPGVVVNAKNGYILGSRNPHELARRVIDIVENGDLSSVSRMAVSTVLSSYTKKSAVDRYRRMISPQTSECGDL